MSNEMVSQDDEILSHNYEIVSQNDEKVSYNYDLQDPNSFVTEMETAFHTSVCYVTLNFFKNVKKVYVEFDSGPPAHA